MHAWDPDDQDMACCDNCNMWIHADCDPEAEAVLQDESLEYCCPNCRDGKSSGHHQSASMLAEYETRLREMKPPKPRSSFLLFSAEMIRLYRNEGREVDHRELVPIIATAWRNLAEQDRLEYANAHEEEAAIYEVQNMQYEAIFEEYEILAANNHHEPPQDLIPDARRPALLPPPSRGGGGGGGSSKRPAYRPSYDEEAPPKKHKISSHPPPDLSGLPGEVSIICNGVRGSFVLASQRVICRCKDCGKRAPEQREFTPTQFEQHCGAGSAKKWKASLRLEPEPGIEGPGMQIGKWLELKGVDTKGSRPHGEATAIRRG